LKTDSGFSKTDILRRTASCIPYRTGNLLWKGNCTEPRFISGKK
jgi:hypothetical protein